MKVNELQIGDYVNYRGQIIKVTSLYDKGGSNEIGWSNKESVWVNADNVEPIPLTSDVLEKNGFELSCDFGNVYSLKESQRFWAVYVSEGVYALGCQSIDSSFANIRYVHQLQHALRICGIEKEIEL